MPYIIKRKLQSVLGNNVDNSQMTTLIQHIQTSTEGLVLPQGNMDTLTVNHLIVKRTLKIPARTDGYK